MILLISIVLLFLFSLGMAIQAAKKELTVPDEVRNVKIPKTRVSGVILFLQEKIIHYTSKSSDFSG